MNVLTSPLNVSLIEYAPNATLAFIGIVLTVFMFAIFFSLLIHEKKSITTTVALIVTFILLVTGVSITAKEKSRNITGIEKTNSNISEFIKSKYGVTVHEKVFTASVENGSNLQRGAIAATNFDEERIQITIELVNNNTDVLAFSSGAEMPKVLENSEK